MREGLMRRLEREPTFLATIFDYFHAQVWTERVYETKLGWKRKIEGPAADSETSIGARIHSMFVVFEVFFY